MSGIDLLRESPHFDQAILIDVVSNPDEIKHTELTLRIIPGTRQQARSTGQNERVIHFEITDENDPYFLYLLDVGEQDFHHLKREQSILVEFAVFPSKIIELIELCLKPTQTKSSLSELALYTSQSLATTSTFSPRLDTITGIFSIVESNMFKQLTHISLQLRPGNDTAIKAYLSSRLQMTLALTRELKRGLETCQEGLEEERAANRSINVELHELRVHRDLDQRSLRASHSEELAVLRMQSMQETEKQRLLYEEKLRTLQAQFDIHMTESSEKVNALEIQIRDLNYTRGELEMNRRDLDRTVESLTSERDKLVSENLKLVDQRVEGEEARLRLERDLARTMSKVETLQMQLQDKDELMAKSTALHRASEDARAAVEDKLNMYVSHNQSLEARIRDLSNELVQRTQSIDLAQQDIRQLRDKIRIKGEVIRRQELIVNDLRHKQSEIERELASTVSALQSSKQQSELLTAQLDDNKKRLADSAKLVASNQEIISYLNEELNKWQLGMSVGAGFDFTSPADRVNLSTHAANLHKDSKGIGGSAAKAKESTRQTATISPDAIPKYDSKLPEVFDFQQQSAYFKDLASNTPSNAMGTTRAGGMDFRDSHDNIPSLAAAAAASVELEKDVYLKGLHNLGLDDESLGLEELGLHLTTPRSTEQTNTNITTGRPAVPDRTGATDKTGRDGDSNKSHSLNPALSQSRYGSATVNRLQSSYTNTPTPPAMQNKYFNSSHALDTGSDSRKQMLSGLHESPTPSQLDLLETMDYYNTAPQTASSGAVGGGSNNGGKLQANSVHNKLSRGELENNQNQQFTWKNDQWSSPTTIFTH